jgi:hypothetical protein
LIVLRQVEKYHTLQKILTLVCISTIRPKLAGNFSYTSTFEKYNSMNNALYFQSEYKSDIITGANNSLVLSQIFYEIGKLNER